MTNELAPALFSFPPFNKIVPRALVPDLAALDAVEGDEVPKARPLADFLDDADALLECQPKSLVSIFQLPQTPSEYRIL